MKTSNYLSNLQQLREARGDKVPKAGKKYSITVEFKLTRSQAELADEAGATLDDIADYMGDEYNLDEILEAMVNQ